MVATSAPNINNISCWKIAPKPLVYWRKNPIELQYIYMVKLFTIELSDDF